MTKSMPVFSCGFQTRTSTSSIHLGVTMKYCSSRGTKQSALTVPPKQRANKVINNLAYSSIQDHLHDCQHCV